MEFNAWTFARSWASVAIAQGADEARPALYRSTLIELFPEGVRLVSTDGYLLLKAWVPVDGYDEPEPGGDVLPDETAICSDPDQRVLAMMKYAQKITKQDGEDTPAVVHLGFGQMKEDMSNQGTLEGMTQASVWFRLGERYDERIETPRFEGAFPEWRPLWFGHEWRPTGVIGFGADGILRLGKLSALWDKSVIEFDLGGQHGVAKVRIQAPDVNVTGLVMPTKLTRSDESVVISVVPPSEEGIHAEYSDVIDEFLASVLREETASDDDDIISDAERAQLHRAYSIGEKIGHLSMQVLLDEMDLSAERCQYILDVLAERGAIEPKGDDKFACVLDGPLFDDEIEEPEEEGDEPL